MDRHAGFAVVAGITEDLCNNLIEVAFNRAPAFTFQLPSPVALGKKSVQIAGDVTLMPPHLVFRKRPDNLITVQLRFMAELRLEGLKSTPRDVLIDLRTSIDAGVVTPVSNGVITPRADLSNAQVTNLEITVQEGYLGSGYTAALRSPVVLDALSQAVRSIPPELVKLTAGSTPAVITLAPTQMPCGASLFEVPEMFRMNLTVSRMVVAVLNEEITIGVDIAGHSAGNPKALRSVFDNTAEPVLAYLNDDAADRYGWTGATCTRRGNVGTSVNPDALVSIINNALSPAIRNAFLDCHVAVDSVRVSLGQFKPEFYGWWVEGANFALDLSYYPSPRRNAKSQLVPSGDRYHAHVTFSTATYLHTFDGETGYVSRHPDYWSTSVWNMGLDVDLPWWVTVGTVAIGFMLPIAFPGIIALFDGIIPSALSNIANDAQKRIDSGINGAMSDAFTSLAGSTTDKLTGLSGISVTSRTNLLSLGTRGFDYYADVSAEIKTDASPDRTLTVHYGGTRIRNRDGAVAMRPDDFSSVTCSVAVKSGVVPQGDPSVRVRWEVRRNDTNQLILRKDRPYFQNRLAAALGAPNESRSIVFSRADPSLHAAEGFSIYVRVYRQLFGRAKEFGSCRIGITVQDRLNRHRPYVMWEHWAQGGQRISAIHRTAVPGRCKMADRGSWNRPAITYLDSLPFAVEDINAHRDELCDYCFYGGPTKSVLLI